MAEWQPLRVFWLILAAAIAVRLCFFLSLQPWEPDTVENDLIIGDAIEYHAVALRMFNGEPLGEAGLARPPLYPLFIASIYKLSGITPWAVLIAQIGLSVGVLFFLYAQSLEWFGERAAVLAAALYAFEPHAVLYSNWLYSDTLYTFLLLAGVVAFSKALRRSTWILMLTSGVLLGLSVLVKPVGQYLIAFPLIATLIWFSRRPMVGLRLALLLAIGYMAAVTPWLARNYVYYDTVAFTNKGGMHLLYWVAAYTEVQISGRPIDEVRADFNARADAAGAAAATNPFERSRIMSDVASKYLSDHAGEYAIVHMRGVFNTFINLDTTGLARILNIEPSQLDVDWYAETKFADRLATFARSKRGAEYAIAGVVVLFLLITYLAAAAGVIRAIRLRRYWPVLVCCGLTLYFLAFVGPISVARYKLPFMPYYLALGGFGLSWLRFWPRLFGQDLRDAYEVESHLTQK